MSELPRGVEARLSWMVNNEPGEVGQCARWTWLSLGDGVDPAAWGCPDANSVVDKTKAAGDLYTGSDPPRGAIVLYTSSGYGHMCLSKGDGQIMTTDPPGHPGGTGTWDIDGPVQEWGQKYAGWSQRYNSVLIPMTEPGPVYVDKLVQGAQDSDSVRRLQDVLNHTSLPAPGDVFLPVLGNYGEDTALVVGVWQTEHGYPKGVITNGQADALFAGSGHTVVHASTAPPDPEPPDPPPGPEGSTDLAWHEYSGKPSGSLTVTADAGYVRLDADTTSPPVAGLEFHMAYLNCDLTWSGSADGTIRVKYVRDDGDATGYADYCVSNGKDDFLITAMHWEAGEAGKGGRWYLNVGGGITKAVITTRYQKAAGVPYELDAAAVAAKAWSGPTRLAVALLVALLAFLVVLGVVLGVQAG